jgi:hypothetical protein
VVRLVIAGPRASLSPIGAPATCGQSEDKAVKNAKESMRAATEFVLHCELQVMSTLTFACPVSRRAAKASVKKLIRRLQRVLGPFPYLYDVEVGRSGRIHVHLAHRRDLRTGLLVQKWTFGRACVPKVDRPWWCAERVAAYITKDFAEVTGEQRYVPARGFLPPPQRVRFSSKWAADVYALGRCGAGSKKTWSSEDGAAWPTLPTEVIASAEMSRARRYARRRQPGILHNNEEVRTDG